MYVYSLQDKVPKEVTAGQTTVAVRMPRHPLASRLIRLAGILYHLHL